MTRDTELLPDRGGLLTEQRLARSATLDSMSTLEIVGLINDEDATVAAAVRRASGAIARFIDDACEGMQRGGRLIYVGAGTSGRLGVLDAAECPPTFQSPPGMVVGVIAGGDAALRKSSEAREDDACGAHGELRAMGVCTDDAVLGIAAGGTTPFVRGAIEFAAGMGACTGLLACARVEPPMGCRHLIVVETGPEVVTGSTRMKAGTATKFVLNTISTTVMVQMGKVYENLMVDLRASNSKLRDRAVRIVSELTGLGRLESVALLEAAGGEVKTAIVMRRSGVNAEDARARIASCGGSLRKAIEAGAPA